MWWMLKLSVGFGVFIIAFNGWHTTSAIRFNNIVCHYTLTVHLLTHSFSVSLSVSCTHQGELSGSSLSIHPPPPTHMIDCLSRITFQTINTIKNPLKPLKPQRNTNHLTIRTHRKKNSLTGGSFTSAIC